MPTPIPAVMIGSPAATTAPKVTSKIRNATTEPMISGQFGGLDLVPGKHAARVLDRNAGDLRGFHRRLHRLTAQSSSTSPVGAFHCTVPDPTRPSGAI